MLKTLGNFLLETTCGMGAYTQMTEMNNCTYDGMFACSIERRVRMLPRNFLTRFNKIATQGAPQMAVDKEANSLSRVYSYYSKFNLCLFYV